MTTADLARRKFYAEQGISPDGPVPDGRLSWEECLELADRRHPQYDQVYEFLRDAAWESALAEIN